MILFLIDWSSSMQTTILSEESCFDTNKEEQEKKRKEFYAANQTLIDLEKASSFAA